jgi:Fe2+ transport system protein FeoA
MSPHSQVSGTRNLLPLELLSAGETAIICEIDGQPELVARLHEMGLRPGCRVKMVRPGPACVVAINNYRLAFRGGEAAFVIVELSEAADAQRTSSSSS